MPMHSETANCAQKFKPNIKVVNWTEGFVMVPNSFARDHSLSHTTRSLLLDTFSRTENWETSVAGLMATNDVGREVARRALSEAEAAGYAFCAGQDRDAGRFAKCQWYLSPSKEAIAKIRAAADAEPKFDALPEAVAPESVKPSPVKRPQLNTILEEKKNRINTDLRQAPSAPAASMNFSVQGEIGSDYPDDFEEWWQLYPRKVGKGEAAKLWSRLKPVQKQKAMTGLRAQLQDLIRMTRDKRGNFCPHAQTWLRQGRFDDMLSEAPVEKKPNPYLERDPAYPEHIWVKRVQNFISRNLVSADEARAYGVPV